MPQAVIVAARRTPIGRAVKGSLAGVRPDDLVAGVIADTLATLPGFDPATLDDIYVGCAEPRDEHGGNVARRVAVQDRDLRPDVAEVLRRRCAKAGCAAGHDCAGRRQVHGLPPC